MSNHNCEKVCQTSQIERKQILTLQNIHYDMHCRSNSFARVSMAAVENNCGFRMEQLTKELTPETSPEE